MERILTSIDVGTSKVCTTTVLMQNQHITEVLGTGIVPSRGIHKAIVRDIAEPTEAIKDSIKEAERSSSTVVKVAYTGITGHHIGSFNNRSTIDITRRDHLVTDREVNRLMEHSKQIALTQDKKIIHAIPRQYYLDGQPVIGSPVGLHGYRLSVETCLITAGVTFIQNLVKCVRGAGVDVMDLILEPIASAEAVLEEDERNKGVVLADIGAGTTDITVFKNSAIWHNAAIPVGGYQFTKDIAIALGLPFNVAEKLKVKYGRVMPDKDSGPKKIGIGKHGVDYQELCYIIEARAEELMRMIFAELPRSEWEDWEPTNLVLCGGTANLPGIEKLVKETLDIPVRVGRPNSLPEKAVMLNNPAYATGVGLLLWGTKYGATQVPVKENVLKRFFSQIGRFRLPRIRLDFGR